jgi:tRNA dimethylallyltransferase
LREEILEDIRNRGAEAVYRELEGFDPEAAEKIHPNNIPRLIRALEVIKASGRRFSDAVNTDRERTDQLYSWRIVGLNMERDLLYDRINKRVLEMIDAGWVDEVKSLLDSGLTGDEKPLAGLGYRDIVAHVRGEKSTDEAVETIQRDTRRFAKRQMTFFRGMKDIEWIDLTPGFDPEVVTDDILARIS